MYRHFTKRLHGLKNLSYGDRLNIVGLESVELHTCRFNNFVYVLLLKNIECNVFIFNSVLNTRGHVYKLVKNRYKLHCRKYSFYFTVINVWNFLSNDIVCCSPVT